MNLQGPGRVSALCLAMVAGASVIAPVFGPVSIASALSPRNAPAAPSGLIASVGTDGRVTLRWTDNSDNETGFRIVREIQAGSSWFASGGASVSANVTTYSESPAPATYRYKIRAYNARGNSSYTPTSLAIVSSPSSPPPPPPPPLSPPAEPSNLRLADLGSGTIQVTWDDNSSDETNFVIERNPAATTGNFTLGANVTTMQDPAGYGTFAYRARAINSAGGSAYTAWASLTTTNPGSPPPPPPPPPPSSGIPVLPSGTGFTGATLQPAAVGAVGSVGYDAKAIGRWDVVPFQTITGDFNVGVVAFDIAGIDRVDFSLNGGAWTPVTAMNVNPQTNVWEYTATIRTSDIPDGPVEVRAIVWPRSGMPRVLGGAIPMGPSNGQHSMFLTSNGHGSLSARTVYVRATGSDANDGTTTNPVRTLNRAAAILGNSGGANGATIYLGAGDYANIGGTATAPTRWLNIMGEPGTSPGQVRITGANPANGLVGTELVHMKNVTIVLPPWSDTVTNYAMFETVMPNARVWLDHCSVQNANMDRHLHVAPLINGADKFVTDTTFNEVDGGPYGAILARGDRINGMINAAYSNAQLVVNCAVDNIEFYGGYHPDVYQIYMPNQALDNYIIYGLRATNMDCQGLNIGAMASMSNMAIVNLLLQKTGGSSMSTQLGSNLHHFLLWDSTILQGITWYGSSDLLNVSFRNSVFQGLYYYDWNTRDAGIAALQAAIGPNSWQNHYVSPLQYGPFSLGTAFTVGDPILVNPTGGDFKPASSSPLQGRVLNPIVPVDAAGLPMPTPGSLGAFQP